MLGDTLPGVLGQLPGKDPLVEVVLELFVGKVDAQLLEAVLPKVLKTVDVKDADLVAFRSPVKIPSSCENVLSSHPIM